MSSISQVPIYSLINGALLPITEAAIPLQDRGFRYGDGVFETMAVHQGVPYQFERHMDRLSAGLKAIRIAFDIRILASHVKQLLQANQVMQGMVRIQVTRGTGSMGYLPYPSPPHAQAFYVIETMHTPPLLIKTFDLWHSSFTRPSVKSLPVSHKTCQGLNSTLARMEAVDHQCFDALLVNEHGYISETSSANIFWYQQGVLYTPALDCGILNGTTRAAVIRLSPYPVREVSAAIEELKQAEAVFMTNVAWDILSISRLQPTDMHWQSDTIAAEYRSLLMKDRETYSMMHRNEWLPS